MNSRNFYASSIKDVFKTCITGFKNIFIINWTILLCAERKWKSLAFFWRKSLQQKFIWSTYVSTFGWFDNSISQPKFLNFALINAHFWNWIKNFQTTSTTTDAKFWPILTIFEAFGKPLESPFDWGVLTFDKSITLAFPPHLAQQIEQQKQQAEQHRHIMLKN